MLHQRIPLETPSAADEAHSDMAQISIQCIVSHTSVQLDTLYPPRLPPSQWSLFLPTNEKHKP